MESPVVGESSVNILLILIFVILFLILLGAIIYYALSFGTVINDVSLGGNCLESNCIIGLLCENNICKQNIGGTCDHLSDCVSTATACQNSICIDRHLSGVGGIPPCKAGLINDNGICKVKVSGICNKDSDCSTGNQCNDGKCSKTKIYSNSSESSYTYASKSGSSNNYSDDSKSSNIISSINKSINSTYNDNLVSPINKKISEESESFYKSQSNSLANIYQNIRSKNKYNINL